ncbi:MAG: protein TolQ [Sphingomonas bacterium]|jgi:biopolymer transport protein TolQ|nr:protein TolQ [Sphingomonas bacterium]
MTPALATEAVTMSPLALFLQADIIVKVVMVGLLAASVWTWAIIITHGLRLKRIAQRTVKFERSFKTTDDIDNFYTANRQSDLPMARVLSAGVGEWRRSTSGKAIDRDGTRSRLASAMQTATDAEVDRLSDRLNILATIGSVAPFVGLFGTVWGIMRSFTSIAAQQNTSLGVVAPGIAEALFATALGLFAAIPSVIAYNRLTHGVNRLEARLNRFADTFHGTLSRELEGD